MLDDAWVSWAARVIVAVRRIIGRSDARSEAAIPGERQDPDYPLADAIMSALALFSLKDPSLFRITQIPSDKNDCERNAGMRLLEKIR